MWSWRAGGSSARNVALEAEWNVRTEDKEEWHVRLNPGHIRLASVEAANGSLSATSSFVKNSWLFSLVPEV